MNVYEKFNLLKEVGINKSSYNVIGELSEKTLHRIIKNIYSDNIENQEVKIDSFYVDVCNGNNIVEVQTRQFNKLRKKLEYLLSVDKYNINVVYPVFNLKYIYVIDELKNIASPRKSNKKLKYPEIFYELYKIKQLLNHERLTITILVFNINEYRIKMKNKKRLKSYDKVPVELINEIVLNNKKDYLQLLPQGLNEKFTSKEVKSLSKCDIRYVNTMLNVMRFLGVLEVVDKKGNQYIYRVKEEAELL